VRERILEAVDRYWEALGFGPRSGVIARMCDMPHSTASEALARLAREGLVEYRRYREVRLTPRGRAVLNEYLRHKRLLETLIVAELHVDHEVAHKVSSRIAMQVPCSLVNRICQKYGHPDRCPAGHPIPSPRGCRCQEGHEDG